MFEQCRVRGMRLSRQRRMVLDLLWTEKSHLSARDIFEKLNARGRSIGHTSVYQTLRRFSPGVIECLDRASGRLYGYRSDPHSHLTCLDSGSIEDIDVELPADLLDRIEGKRAIGSSPTPFNSTGDAPWRTEHKLGTLMESSCVPLGCLHSGADVAVGSEPFGESLALQLTRQNPDWEVL